MVRTKKNIQDIYPLTPLQRGILFHSVDAEGSTAPYFAHTCFELRGALDVSALERAWQIVIDRHELLRSDVVWQKTKEPFQIVYRQLDVKIEHVVGVPEADVQARLLAIMDDDRRHAFEFGRSADARLVLVQATTTLHYLLWGHHHVTLDGWSASNVLGEVLLVYKALVHDETPDLPPVPSYRAYLDWLGRRDHVAAERWWQDVFDGCEGNGPLTLAAPTSWDGKDKYAEQHFVLDEADTERLRAVLQGWQVTPNTFFQGMWGMLLRELSGAKEAVLGVTISGRPADLPGAGAMVGMFINTLPLRIAFPPQVDLRTWLRVLQQRAIELQDHGFVGLSNVASRVNRGGSQAPLFESIIVFENYPMRGIADGLKDLGLEVGVCNPEGMIREEVSSSQRRNNFPVTLVVAPGPRLDVILAYHRDRVADDSAALLLSVLKAQIDLLVAPQSKPGERTVLSALACTNAALTRAVRTNAPPGEITPHALSTSALPIHARIGAHETARAAQVAVRFEKETLTWAELGARASQVARLLATRGVGRGARVGVCMARSHEFIVALYGVLKAGAAYVPLDPSVPVLRLRAVLDDADVRVVLADRGAKLDLGDGVEVLSLDDVAITHTSTEHFSTSVHPDEAAYILYTSGSTGEPKGVVVTHRGIDGYVRAVLDRLALPEGESMAVVSTTAADLGNTTLFGALVSGRTLHVIAEARAFDANAMAEYMNEHAVGVLKIVPSHLKGLLASDHPAQVLPRHTLVLGGEATPWELVSTVERLGTCRIFNHYGPTETTVGVLAQEHRPALARESRTLPLGKALANSRVEVLSAALHRVPAGVEGDVYVSGLGLARGYLGRADLTADRFVPDPFGANGERMYRTGDRARVLSDGSLEFVGRADDQIKLRGHRIELEEIRAVLLASPSVEDGVVVVEHGAAGNAHLVAYVVPTPDASRDAALLLRSLEARLPEYMVPTDVVWLERLPLTKNGKLDRRALPRREGVEARACLEPRTEREKQVAEIWKTVLKLDRFGVDENFFKLGGDSLLGFQVVALARKAGMRFSPPDLFDHPTVESLAALLEERGAGKAAAAPVLPKAETALDPAKPAGTTVLERADRIAPTTRTLGQRLPLSPSQKRMWFEWRFAPNRASYNIAAAVRLSGVLAIDAMQAALSDLVLRHEPLRTRFVEDEGRVFQVVERPFEVALPRVDLREGPAARIGERTRAYVEREALEPFDLAAGPVIRAKLLGVGETEHVLLVTIHHIASDGWSSRLLIEELGALYADRRAGKASTLPAPPLQYADYVVWQGQWLASGELERQLAYWTKAIGAEHDFLELPTDRPRTSTPGEHGGTLTFEIDRALTQGLRSLANSQDATPFMVLLSVFMVLVGRHANRRDVRVGVPHANRHRPELERVVGCFVNTHVLRAELQGTSSFEALLASVKGAALGAQAHQDLPFEQLVEALNPPRSLTHTPVFQVTFNYQRIEPSSFAEMAGVHVTPLERDVTTSPFELSLDTEESDERIVARFTYDAGLFDRATVERWAGHFHRLLEAAVQNPRQSIEQMPLLRDHERYQQLVVWNQSDLDLPEVRTVAALIAEQARRTPDAVAVSDAQGELTYAELEACSNQLARVLRRRGVRAEDRVGLCVERSRWMVVGLLGIQKSGAAYVPLDAEYPEERLRFVVKDSSARLVVTETALADKVAVPGVLTWTLDGAWNAEGEAAKESTQPLESTVGADNLAYCIYTSGSTGTPKGVEVTHGALVNVLWSMKERPGLTANDRVLGLTSLSFDIAGLELYWPLVTGARVVLASREAAHSPSSLLELVARTGVTVMQATPSTWRMVSEAPGFGALTLKVALCGGEALSPELSARLVAQLGTVWNVYGPTETTIWSSRHALDAGSSEPRVGGPLGNTSLYVLDGRMEPVGINVVGEVWIGGAGLARGYHGRPDLTSERFVPNPHGGPGERLYRTGDLGKWSSEGTLAYVGRVDHQVKVRGYRIELGEIESALRGVEGVRDAAVTARESGEDKRLVAYVVSSSGEVLEGEGEVRAGEVTRLRESLGARLPDYMVPSLWVFLPALPLTGNGKVDRKALPEPQASEGQRAYVAPQTELEKKLAAIWSEVLRVERVGLLDDFFVLGGHSLLATQVTSRIARDLGITLPLRVLFEAPTLGALAARLGEIDGTDNTPTHLALVPVARTERMALSHGQKRMWIVWRLRPESAAYNIAAAFRVIGALDVARLGRAFGTLVDRHDILRTRFFEIDGDVFQSVDESRSVDVEVTDLRAFASSEVDIEAEARRIAEAEALAPFHLETGPLLRVKLLRVRDLEHVLLVTMHHIVADGWSLTTLVDELRRGYVAGGENARAPSVRPLQYIDYAAWQERWLAGPERERQLAYWTKQLGHEHPVLTLPSDRPRRPVQSYDGAEHPFVLDEPVTRAIGELARRHGASTFMVVLAAFHAVLHRLSGQPDIRVGSPHANRNQVELEGVIGPMINVHVLRAQIDPRMPFVELLAHVKETCLGAQANQELPFELLVEALNPERSLGHNPLFQVSYHHQARVLDSGSPFGDVELRAFERDKPTTQFDLVLHTEDVGGELRASFTYSTDLFDGATVEMFARVFGTMLRAIVDDPKTAVGSLRLFDAGERATILGSGAASPTPFPTLPTFALIAEQASRTPDAVAVSDAQGELTYAELEACSNQLARVLRKRGVRAEDRVGLCVERSRWMVVGLLGIQKSGAAYVPLDAEHPEERLRFVVKDSAARLVVTETALASKVSVDGVLTWTLDGAWNAEGEAAKESTQALESTVGADNLAYCIYTSGSTGTPKGVEVTHGALVNVLWSMKERPGLTASDRVLGLTSLSFDIAGLELYWPLVTGASVVLASREAAHSPSSLLELVARTGVTVMQATPSTWRMVSEAPGFEGLTLKVALCGGEALSPELSARLVAQLGKVWNVYGPTETTIWSSRHALDVGSSEPRVGGPLGNTSLYVLDGRMEPVGINVVGEVWIGGAGLARGYHGRPDLTSERFVPNPHGRPGERLYRTGDLGKWSSEGTLAYVGRVDHQVKVRGYRIELGEIESALRGVEGVRDAAVTARESGGDKRLVAYVVSSSREVLEGEGEVRAGEVTRLRESLGARLPDYMVPSLWVFLPALPLTSSGKVDRKALPEPQASEGQRAYVAPQTELEKKLAAIWSEVLRVERVGLADHFFTLGGDSIMVLQVVGKATRAGIPLDPKDLFQHQTLEALVAHVAHRSASSQSASAKRTAVDCRLKLSTEVLARFGVDAGTVEEIYPMTPMQQGLMTHSLLGEQGSGMYHMQNLYRIGTAIDGPAFDAAWTHVVRRQAILRSSFHVDDEHGALQIVHHLVPEPTRHWDLRALPADAQQAEIERILTAERREGFNLAHPRSFRVHLFHTGNASSVLVVSHHHLLMDAWCNSLILKEFLTCYRATSHGLEPAAPTSPPYRTYVDWLVAQSREEATAFWTTELAGIDAVTPLPFVRTSDADLLSNDRVDDVHASLSAKETSELTAMARKLGVTPNVVLQAAWAMVLSKHVSSHDVLLGVTVAGRPMEIEGVESILGLFIQSLPLRVRIDEKATVRDWLVGLLESNARIRHFEYLSLPEIRAASAIRDNALFHSLFVLENAPVDDAVVQEGLLVHAENAGNRTHTNYPLTVVVYPGDTLALHLSYNANIFERGEAELLLAQYHAAVLSLVREVEGHVGDVSIASHGEAHITVSTQGTRVERDGRSFVERFEEQVAKSPDRVVARCMDEAWTRAELDARANAVAWGLIRRGVKPDGLVAVLDDRGLPLLAMIVGSLKANAAYLPLDPRHPLARIVENLRIARPQVVICTDARRDDLVSAIAGGASNASPIVVTIEELFADDTPGTSPHHPLGAARTRGDQLAYVIHTSGSTGTPKGVMVEHRGMANNQLSKVPYLRLTEDDVIAQTASQCFDISVWQFLLAPQIGAVVEIVPDLVAGDPQALFAHVAARKITVLESVPSLLRAALQEGRMPAPDALALRWMLPTGEALPADVARRWFATYPHVPLVNAYGPAECSDDVSFLTLTEAPTRREDTIPLGVPVDNTNIYIFDARMKEAPLGVAGELCVSGVGVGRGYLFDPALTADRFVPHPNGAPGERIYRTGDLGRRRPDGVLEFLGRADHQVKVRGFRIELGEIESRLQKLDLVRDAVVVAHEDERAEKRLVAYVVLEDDTVVDAPEARQAELRAALLTSLAESLPEYIIPSHVALLTQLPLGPNGKIDRKALPAPRWLASREMFVAPRNELENALADIWREVLGVETIGVHDRFFQLGGHSLLATQMMSRVARRFDIDLPLRTIFEASELGAFAERVAAAVGGASRSESVAPIQSRSRVGHLPLAAAQQRLWFLWQLQPESAAYNINVAVRLRGDLDRSALGRSLDALVARHETLRTRFEDLEGHGIQTIDAPTHVECSTTDLTALSAEDIEAEAARYIEEEAARPFNLRSGPVFRAKLVRTAVSEHVLVLSMHHITSDAWSMRILVDELSRLYAANVAGQSADLAPLEIQYADYAQWQSEWLEGGGLDAQLAYWKNQLGTEHPVLRLPTDRPRPRVQTYGGARQSFALDPALVHELRALAARTSSTLFVLILAAFDVLLYRYSGQPDIRVGVPNANRHRLEVEGLIGFFVNTHVIRAQLSGSVTFNELVARVRTAVLGAQSNPDYPFEKLVSELNPERSLGHSPLFQVSYDHQVSRRSQGAQRTGAGQIAGLELTLIDRPRPEVPFELTLVSEETEDGGIEATFEYVRDLFDASTLARMGEHLVTILRAMTRDTSARIGGVALERGDTLERPRSTARPTNCAHRDMAVHAWIRHRAQTTPTAIAVECDGRRLSFAELEHCSNQLAHMLVRRGVASETLVGVCLDRSTTLVVAMLAVMKAGGAYVPLDPNYPTERLVRMMRDAAMPLVIAAGDVKTARAAAEAEGIDLLDLDVEPWHAEPAAAPAIRRHPDHLAYVIFTSGSTGVPKGVAVTHGSLTTHCQAIIESYRLRPEDHALHFASMGFDAAVEQWIAPLMCGARLVMTPPRLWSAEEAVTELDRLGITWFEMPPAYVTEVARWAVDHGRELPVRGATVGGEALTRETFELLQKAAPRATIFNAYGPAEAVVTPLVWTAEPETRCRTANAPLGRVVGERTAYVLDANLQRAPVGVVGELYIGGAGISRGYWRRADWTAARFVPDPFGAPGSRLYRTGDLVRKTQDGELEYLGRNDLQVKIRGFRVELEEVEAVLAAHPKVGVVTVVARELHGTKVLVAYVVPKAPGVSDDAQESLDPQSVKSWLRERLPEYMVPAHVVTLPRLPLTAHGKVDRLALPEPSVVAGGFQSEPESDAERTLVAIWRDLLRVERVGIDDNFFDLGGDSILSIQLVSRARDAGLSITPRSVFEHQTVRTLARAASASSQGRSDTEPTEALVPLSPIQRAFFEMPVPNRHHWNQSVMLATSRPLVPTLLERAWRVLLQHHDALRLRFALGDDGVWTQRYGDAPDSEIVWCRGASSSAELHAITESVQQSLNLERGELVRASIISMADGTTRLLLVVHHLVVDGVSWRVLLEDLQSVYGALERNEPARLPAKTSSYEAWSHALLRYASTDNARASAAYWAIPSDLPTIPRDGAAETGVVRDIASATMTLDHEATQRLLRDAPAAHRTQILDLLLAALANAIETWSGQPRVLVELEGHGRDGDLEGVDTTRTVGWFTNRHPVLLESFRGDAGETIRRTKTVLGEARKHALAYGLAETSSKAGGLPELPRPRITFNYLGQFETTLNDAVFTVADENAGPERSDDAPIDNWLAVDGEIHGGVLTLTWRYSREMYRTETVERLVRAYEDSFRVIIGHCCEGRGRLSVEDFPLAKLTQVELDELPLEHGGEPDGRDVQDIYPLSPMQQGMVFQTLHGEDPSAYVNQHRVRVEGLDVERFEGAFEDAVRRHDVLRTSVFWGASLREPVQIVRRAGDARSGAVERIDATGADEASLTELAAKEILRGFDLAKAPLTRVVIADLGDGRCELVWTTHHAILDGWSTAALIGEVMARCTGQPIPPEPRGRYGDFIAWLARRDPATSEAFWRRELEDVEPVMLCAAPRRTDGRGFARVGLSLHGETWERIQRFARKERVTINTLVQGAWSMLLSRRTGKERVVFGATVSGRPASLRGAETMLGLFINTLPVVTTVPTGVTCGAWLRNLQAKNLRMREHEEAPLYEIQRWAGRGGEALFDTLLVFENYPVERALREGASTVRFGEVSVVERTEYPLTLTVTAADTLDITLGFERSVLAEGSVEALATELRDALLALTEDAQRALGRASHASAKAWRREAEACTGAILPRAESGSILESIEAQVRARPDARAVVFEGRSLTYAELDARSNQLARHLRHLGVTTEALVGVHMDRSLDLVVTLLGIMKAGAAYVPLEPEQPIARLTDIVEEAELRVIVTQQHLHAAWADTRGVAVWDVDAGWCDAASLSSTSLGVRLRPENIAYCIHTSGSTGKPKGAAVPHGGLRNRLDWMAATYGIGETDVVLQKTPYSFDVSVWELFLPLMVGATLVVARPGAHRDPRDLLDVMVREGVTTMHFVPSMLRAFLETADPSPCTALRHVMSSGEALGQDLVAAWKAKHGAEIHNLYGPTEASIDVTAWPCGDDLPANADSVPIGRAIWNTRMYVLDGVLAPAAPGAVGELYIGGIGLARAYVKRPDVTAERFVPDPFVAGARMYRTGDIARHLGDGVLAYLGRVDQQVKIRGVRIELGEIEAALRSSPRVSDAVVVVRPNGKDVQIEAYVVAARGAEGDEPTNVAGDPSDELREYLRARLPEAMIPRRFVSVAELPRTVSGKLDRKALLATYGAASSDDQRSFVAPASERERALAAIWEDVLQVPRVGREDSFFDLGGHSLLAVRLTHRLRGAFGIDISVRDVFEAPTVAALAERIEHRASSDERERGRAIAEALEQVENMSVSDLAALLDDPS